MTPDASIARHLMIGAVWRARGDVPQAMAAYRAALACDPDCLPAHLELAQIIWPGPDYLAVLTELHRLLRPRRYVEIGVDRGASLRLAADAERAIGIDPAPVGPPPAGTIVIAERAQACFARGGLDEALSGGPVDLAFIDGSHRFEDVLDDFIALEPYLHPRSAVLLHDCLPLDAATATPERHTKFWTGDVWKLVPTLRTIRPHLSITTFICPPSGLCLISGFDQGAGCVPEAALVRSMAALAFEDFATYRPLFGLRPADMASVERTLHEDHNLL